MTEQEARERVKDLKSFYGHLISYLLINAGILATFFLTLGPEALVGPLLVLLCWGGGLSIHAMRVFGLFGIGSPAWEEQKVRELLGNKGLSKEELTQVLRQALHEAAAKGGESAPENERILERLNHLEAIVTSEDWDLLQEKKEPEEAIRDQWIELDQEGGKEEEHLVEKLSKRVR